ncbi:enoyl-CoA hydratase/isomerase family protein [Knoellia sp. CPCC 206435]|uniref:enoyl-CoA hydratase/isomerase family protein n=1 Tax=Knoellia terrae TaxID=3404797 RepID=UPI003B435C09
MSEVVRLEVADGIGVIRLDRPPMNALNDEVQHGLIAASKEATERKDVAAVVVYGGAKVFAAGADIKQMVDMSYTDMADHSLLLQDFTRALARIPKPTVAAITGYALGGGCEVALACDFRIAARGARLGQPEILLGIIPGAGGTQRLARLVGPARAKDIIFTGRFVDADEALAIGLVDEVVDVEEGSDDAADPVLAAARRMMQRYAGGPAYAIRAAKEAIDSGLEVDLQSGLEIERMLFTSLFATKDRETGMRSFVEKGPGKASFEGA